MKSPLDDAILAARTPDVAGWRKIDEVPFDFERRRVSVLLERDGERLLVVKGAPEDMLRLSDRHETPDGQRAAARRSSPPRIHGDLRRAGRAGLPGARHRHAGVVAPDHATAVGRRRGGLVFAGFAVFLDPPKASARATIQALGTDGVTVKLLTGDNEQVTRHVLREIGVTVTGVLTGDELRAHAGGGAVGQLRRINLFCRVTPQQKQRILLALKRIGHVVGFLGDGINDAPALHAADVGISVDSAADVARQAADLILLEHDLSRRARGDRARAARPCRT